MSLLLLLSPAKALDFETPSLSLPTSAPIFQQEAGALMEFLRTMSVADIANLMGLSEKLAQLNHARYQAWQTTPEAAQSTPAIFAFNGDVYEGLDARSLSLPQCQWLGQHLRILSGLYGVLRPFDALQAYRLEMGTSLQTSKGNNLYQWWGQRVTDAVNQTIEEQGHHAVLNLASQEYFKVLQPKRLRVPVVECQFKDESKGEYKTISFFAKRARGLMARWMATEQITKVEDLRGFASEGYAWSARASSAQQWVFCRTKGAVV